MIVSEPNGPERARAARKSWLLKPKGRTVNVMSDCGSVTEWPRARARLRAGAPDIGVVDLKSDPIRHRTPAPVMILARVFGSAPEVATMTMRSRHETITFRHPFRIASIGRELAAGAYDVVTDEEMIEGLSFPCFRRVATMIMVPAAAPHGSSMEMLSIGSVELADAQRIDASAPNE